MKEREIRPEALLKRYLELSAADAAHCFGGAQRSAIPCVACGGDDTATEFAKHGFEYVRCSRCGTLYQSPRPPLAEFEAFYRDSASARYWAEVFFPAVAEVRREKMFRARVNRIAALAEDRGIAIDRLIDVGAGYGIFLDEWRARFPQSVLVAIEPSASLAAECRAKQLTVVESLLEQTEGYDAFADLVTCFEVLEHAYDPVAFVQALRKLARPGGYVLVTTLCIDGFDLQMLWDRSTQISPPHHINFMSAAGFERLFDRAGLEDVFVTTPGQLDVDIVRNVASADPGALAGHRFVQTLLADESASRAFQTFLADNRLSSHAWVIGRRPASDRPAA